MNDEQIEKLLRKGQAIRVPEDLLGKLQAGIRVPRATSARTGFDARPAWLKRWLPALAFASILLMCVVVVAVQTNLIAELKHENEKMRAVTGNLEALRAANAEYQKLSAQNQELERVRQDNAASSTFVVGINHSMGFPACLRRSRASPFGTQSNGSRELFVWWPRTNC